MESFTTGTGPLDRELRGGFAPGSLVAYVAAPDVQAETLLFQLAAQRRTLYVTTVMPAETVERQVERLGGEAFEVLEHSPTAAEPPDLDVPEGGFVVLDAVNALERLDPDAYHEFLSTLGDRLRERDAVGVLHAVDGHDVVATRDWTLRAADTVLVLDVSFEDLEPESRLQVRRLRGAEPPDEALKVQLGEDVGIDTSWEM